MSFNKVTTYEPSQNILASERSLVLKTHEGTPDMVKEANAQGRKVLKAGELYTDKTTNEVGIVFEDIDLTDYDKYPVSVVMAGHVLYDRVSEEAQAKQEDFIKQGLYLDEKKEV